MNKPDFHLSIEDINANLAEQLDKMKPSLDLDDIDGCVARGQRDVLPALTHWRAAEMNRGTHPMDRFNAVLLMAVSSIVAEMKQNGLTESDIPSLAQHIQGVMLATMTAPPEEWTTQEIHGVRKQ